MNYLVTGGAGFIGSHLVDELLAGGHTVTVLDNFSNGSSKNLPDPAKVSALTILRGDITDSDTCRKAVSGMDGIFHLACLGVRHSLHSPIENHQVNALGTLYLLEAARDAEIPKFLYLSTSEIYGRARDFPITENTTPWPLTVYGSSKLAAEHYVRSFFECYQLPVLCLRCFNNYGPRAHFAGDSGEVIPRFILRLLAGEPPQIFGDGSHTRDFLYVKDAARMLRNLMEKHPFAGEVFNFGYGREITILELARTLIRIADREDIEPEFLEQRPADVPRLWVETSRLMQHLTIQSLRPFADGLEPTYAYYRDRFREDPTIVQRIVTRNWQS